MCNISSTISSIFIVILWLFICNLYEKNHIDWGRFNSVKPILLRLSVLGDFIKFSFGFIFFLIPIPRGHCSPACRANCPKLSSFSAIYSSPSFGSRLQNFMHFSPSSLTAPPPSLFQLKWRSLHWYLHPIKWILHYQPHSPDILYPPFISLLPLRFLGCLPGTYGKNSKSCKLHPLRIIPEFKQPAPWAQHVKH